MNIAFLSYEYPIEKSTGGIGTYLQTISSLLRGAGHHTVIFTATEKPTAFWFNEHVFCIPALNWAEFNIKLPQYFIPIHHQKRFDVAEGTDFYACGLYLKKALPGLPMVAKLHTPLYIVDHLLFVPQSIKSRLRFLLGGLKRSQYFKPPQPPLKEHYQDEFEFIKIADRISSPSVSIMEMMIKYGFEIKTNADIVPLPSISFDSLKTINNFRANIQHNAEIIFIGRMEIRKGVVDLANAIPVILKKHPGTKFTFIGQSSQSPVSDLDMISFLRKKLAGYSDSVTFTGQVNRNEIPDFLQKGDICVFPSHYESFGLAVCEAMHMEKAVIGSTAGAMAEIIEDGINGLLIKPKSPGAIADKIIHLIEDDKLRLTLGQEARKRINTFYSSDIIVPLQIENYKKAIAQVNGN